MRVCNLTAFWISILLLLGTAGLANPALAARGPRVEICHLPPGNPDNFQTITISENAVASHFAHGDYAGACDAAPVCGNGFIDGDEDCDGFDLAGASCGSLGYTLEGTLSCSAGCSYDTQLCQSQACPATGQVRCWDGFGASIECAGTNHDGEIQAGAALSYVDNGDGTITDLNTGLMWEKKGDDGGLHDNGNTYPWWSTNPSVDAIWDWLDDVNAEGGTGFAGYSDWRIPNVKELHSLIYYETINPSIDPVFDTGCVAGCTVTTCSCTGASSTWSATSAAVFTNLAITVTFSDGSVTNRRKRLFSLHVRAVRGGP